NGAFFYFFSERAQQPVEVALLPAVAALCMAFIKINQPHAAIGIEQNIVNIQIGMVHLSLVQTGYFDADMTVLFGIQRALLQQVGQLAGGGYFGGNQVGAVTQAAFDRPRRQWPGHIDAGCTQCTEQGKFLLAAAVVPAAEPIAITHQFAEQTTAAVMAQRRLTGITGNKPGGTAAAGLAQNALLLVPVGGVEHRQGRIGQPLRVVPDGFVGRQLPVLHKGPGKVRNGLKSRQFYTEHLPLHNRACFPYPAVSACMPLFNQPPESVCFVRLSAIGDVCHAVAAVQALQRHWPQTRVTWVVGKIEAQLLQGLAGVELVVYDKKAGWAGMRAVWQQLQGQRFDALVHMQLALRASLLTLGIKARYKVGFNRRRAKEGQWLFTNRKITDTESQHVLDSFYAFIEYLGVPPSAPQWQLPLSDADQEFARQQLQQRATVVICPAASKDERNWLPERYAAFADYVVNQGFQVAVCGS